MASMIGWRRIAVVAGLALLPAATAAKEQVDEREAQAAYDAHQAEFDYLLGDWEFAPRVAVREVSRLLERRRPPTAPSFRTSSRPRRQRAHELRQHHPPRLQRHAGTVEHPRCRAGAWRAPGGHRLEGGEGHADQPDLLRGRRGLESLAHPLPRHPARPVLLARRPLDRRRQDVLENFRTIEARRIGAAAPLASLTPSRACRVSRWTPGTSRRCWTTGPRSPAPCCGFRPGPCPG